MLKISTIVLLLSLFFISVVVADPPPLTAEDIVGKMLRNDAFKWEGAKTRLRMVLLDRSGERQERLMMIIGRRHQGLLQTMVRFLEPSKIAGTAFLMLERENDASEQYVYLSGLKRTRRIVGREREGSFMGSDFTYADMQRLDAKYADNKRLSDEEIGGTKVYVIQSTISKEAPVAYSKVVSWVRKTDFISLRTRFYDKQAKLAKTLYARRVRVVEGNPVIMEARMQNNQTGHATELIVESIERRNDLPDVAFTPNALEHW
ncbi:MAG: outer membrane lipoprotein-sorting protein [Deltaproteobacteria bacterium]|nr:outer membrane lipoprotein-sorting protein [Deltaproteobacteria bacterium]